MLAPAFFFWRQRHEHQPFEFIQGMQILRILRNHATDVHPSQSEAQQLSPTMQGEEENRANLGRGSGDLSPVPDLLRQEHPRRADFWISGLANSDSNESAVSKRTYS
jgi:hypothetical protein